MFLLLFLFFIIFIVIAEMTMIATVMVRTIVRTVMSSNSQLEATSFRQRKRSLWGHQLSKKLTKHCETLTKALWLYPFELHHCISIGFLAQIGSERLCFEPHQPVNALTPSFSRGVHVVVTSRFSQFFCAFLLHLHGWFLRALPMCLASHAQALSAHTLHMPKPEM